MNDFITLINIALVTLVVMFLGQTAVVMWKQHKRAKKILKPEEQIKLNKLSIARQLVVLSSKMRMLKEDDLKNIVDPMNILDEKTVDNVLGSYVNGDIDLSKHELESLNYLRALIKSL